VVGHVIFTRCGIEGMTVDVSLLAPLAVVPACQRQGVGTALVQEGLRRLIKSDAARVYVLGDPVYYGRFGFLPDDEVAPPYPLPPDWRDAWQSLGLRESDAPPRGQLTVPPSWRDRALWSA
ncbi:MAG: N-acetyltransferase, partial [Pseudomonadota bacterium]